MSLEKSEDRRLLSTKEVSEIFGKPLNQALLERLRRCGGGPKFFKTGPGRTAQIYYRISDIEEWIEKNSYQSTAEIADYPYFVHEKGDKDNDS